MRFKEIIFFPSHFVLFATDSTLLRSLSAIISHYRRSEFGFSVANFYTLCISLYTIRAGSSITSHINLKLNINVYVYIVFKNDLLCVNSRKNVPKTTSKK